MIEPSGPARVLLVRHAEKPRSKRDPSLSAKGRQSAERLARLLPVRFPFVAFLFAARSRPTSRRPEETLEPMASLLGLPIDTRFDEDDPDVFARELAEAPYAQAHVLVAWRHDGLPALARALGAQDVPETWDAAVYDRLWIIDYGFDRSVRFRDERLWEKAPAPVSGTSLTA